MPDYRAMARQKAAKYGVDPAIFERQIGQESNFDPNAKSPVGAKGIAQIMTQYHPGVDATDPEASLDYAARLMAGYLKQYNGDYRLALAAYNAGAGNVAKYGGVPPFEETQTYIANILGGQRASQSGVQVAQAGMSDFADNTSQGVTMAGPVANEPQQKGDPVDVWLDFRNLDKYGQPTISYEPPMVNQGGVAGIDWLGGSDVLKPGVKHAQLVTYDNGESFYSFDDGTATYAGTDPQLAAANKAPNETSQWSIQTRADGSKARVNEITGETAPLEGFGPKAPAPQMYTNRQRSDPGDSMSGPSQWNERVPVVDTRMNGRQLWGLPEGGTQYELIQEFPDTSASTDGVGWANLAQRKQEFDQQMAWNRVKADMEREEKDRTLQGQLYNHINNIWAQNLPRMGDPSQVYFAGAGPGGPLETLFKQGGSTYDPNQGKIAWQNFDQNAAWKQAAGMVRR